MRRVHLMLLVTVVLWALNLTVTRYILQHGFEPLAYATVRYGLASAIFIAIVVIAERTLRIERRDLKLVLVAALALLLNQLAFVYALDTTSASTIALLLGATPAIAAVIGLALGFERMSGRFWAATLVSFAGVGLVAAGSGSSLDAGWVGIALGLATAATWAVYSIAIAPLDEPLHRLADQRRRAAARLGRDPRSRAPRRRRARTTPSAGRSGRCSSSRPSARSSSRTSSGSARSTESAPRARR